jgi:hypothetical protein
MTIIPITTVAAAAPTHSNASAPNAAAAAGRPSRFISAKRVAPRIASEKTSVTPIPAAAATMTVFSNAWVSTIVASIMVPAPGRSLAPAGRRR